MNLSSNSCMLKKDWSRYFLTNAQVKRTFFTTIFHKYITFFEDDASISGKRTAVWELDKVNHRNMIRSPVLLRELWLVDLIGSERVAKTYVQGDNPKEEKNFNKSLSALGDEVSSLATENNHIPFRNSKLAHLLQDSLGENSKTLMFVQISPNENIISKALCPLNFANIMEEG